MTTLLNDGIWTWFNFPVVSVSGDDAYLGVWPSTFARPVVSRFNIATDAEAVSVFPSGATNYETDDHDNPAVLVLDNGKILAAWSVHNGDSACCRTVNAGDIRTWESINNVNTASDDSYCLLWQAGDTNGTVYWFYRRNESGYRPRRLRTSTNDGDTWTEVGEFVTVASQRPYMLIAPNGSSRVDFFISTGQPDEVTCSLYHFYMTVASDGTRAYYKTDGTLIGDDTDLPLGTADMTLVWDGATANSWIWDIKIIGGSPVVAFATFANSDTEHTYRIGTWSGSAWSTEEVCSGGTSATADYLYATEVHYSGGISLDPNDVNSVYVSREYGIGDFRVEKWTKSGSWAKTTDVSGNTSSVNARPVAFNVGGSTRCIWWQGAYTSYTSYDTSVQITPAMSFRTAKPATPTLNLPFTPPGGQLYLPMQEGSGTPADILGNYTPAATGAPTWSSDALGGYVNGFTTDNYFSVNSLAAAYVAGGYPRWIAVLFENTSTTSAQYIIGVGRSTTTTPLIGLAINNGAAGTVSYVVRDDSNASVGATDSGNPCNDGNKHVMMGVSFAANRHSLYFDGQGAATSTNTAGTITVDRFTIGALNRTSVTNAYGGKVFAVLVGFGWMPPPDELYADLINGRFSGLYVASATGNRRRRLLICGAA